VNGIFKALLTPFRKDGCINDQALCELVEINIEKGVNGFMFVEARLKPFFLTWMSENISLKRLHLRLKADVKSLHTLAALALIMLWISRSMLHNAKLTL
jgi:hypothetical protein